MSGGNYQAVDEYFIAYGNSSLLILMRRKKVSISLRTYFCLHYYDVPGITEICGAAVQFFTLSTIT